MANSYWVDGVAGNDTTGNGSVGTPWASIQKAADTMVAGDDVTIKAFASYGRTTISISGTSENYITYQAETNPSISYVSTNAVVGNQASLAVTKGFEPAADYIKIIGLEVTEIGQGIGVTGGIEIGGDYIEVTSNYFHELNCRVNGYGAIRGAGDNITVNNNHMWKVEGISITIWTVGWTVEGNNISHCTANRSDTTVVAGDADAIRFFGHDHVIRNNNIHDLITSESTNNPHMDCFQTYSLNPGELVYNVVIEKNYCYNIGTQFANMTDTEGEHDVHDITIRNNIFRLCHAGAFNVYNVEYLTIANNIIIDARYQLLYHETMIYCVTINNLFYQDPDGPYPVSGTGSGVFAGPLFYDGVQNSTGWQFDYNLHYPDFTTPSSKDGMGTKQIYGKDPDFLDFDNIDYHPTSVSPTIDVGTTTTDVTDDYDDVVRPQGSAYDIGAYEYEATESETVELSDNEVATDDISTLKLMTKATKKSKTVGLTIS